MNEPLKTVLVVGATGKSGRSVVEQLLDKDHKVRVIVRSPAKLSTRVLNSANMKVVEASVLDLTDEELAEHVRNCDAVVSCLGHVVNFKGMFGEPNNCVQTLHDVCVTQLQRILHPNLQNSSL